MPRKKEFTIPEILARAVRRFSKYGYHATSIRDLVLAMRIRRGSIYGTFASKRASGLSVDLKARVLVAHEVRGFREWGAAAALAYDPRPETERGLSVALKQAGEARPREAWKRC